MNHALGKGLLACTSGIAGLAIGGPLLAAVGILAGIIGGELFIKKDCRVPTKRNL